MRHEVFCVLDRSFTGDMWSLSRRAHIWLVESDRNQVSANAVWEREAAGSSPLRGVTTFAGSENMTETLYRLLGTIDEHHGEHAAARPWDVLHIVGVSIDDVESDRLDQELGVGVSLQEEPGGFAIQRLA